MKVFLRKSPLSVDGGWGEAAGEEKMSISAAGGSSFIPAAALTLIFENVLPEAFCGKGGFPFPLKKSATKT